MSPWLQPVVFLAAAALPASALAAPWGYHDPGDLEPGSGQGRVDWMVYAPGMRYPMEAGPSYANSQVYRPGGSQGGGGSQCDAENYDYPWRDNYCEIRSWDMPLCPAGTGHQGQDIRAATCEKGVHRNVATADGTITNIGSYSVYLTDATGTRYDFLHGENNQVSVGQDVSRGAPINYVSNNFGGTSTTIHLHFNIKQDVAGYGFVYVPPYMSLVAAYEDLMGFANKPPDGEAAADTCEILSGWAQDPDTPGDPVSVEIWFDGPRDEPTATGVAVVADAYRMELCDTLGSCDHGFEVAVPLSIRDDYVHPVHLYGKDTEGGAVVEFSGSPVLLTCPRPPAPEGVRRIVATPEVLAAWSFSPFWMGMRLTEEELLDLPEGPPLPSEPRLVRDLQGALWLLDPPHRRPVSDETVAAAWGLDADAAPTWSDGDLSPYPIGPPLRPEPILVRGPAPIYYLVDDPACSPEDPDCGAPGSTGGTAGAGTSAAGGSSGPDAPGLPEDFGDGDGDAGCGCRVRGATPARIFLLAPAVWTAARRRRRKR